MSREKDAIAIDDVSVGNNLGSSIRVSVARDRRNIFIRYFYTPQNNNGAARPGDGGIKIPVNKVDDVIMLLTKARRYPFV